MRHNFYIFIGDSLTTLAKQTLDDIGGNQPQAAQFFHAATATNDLLTPIVPSPDGQHTTTQPTTLREWTGNIFAVGNTQSDAITLTLLLPIDDDNAPQTAARLIEEAAQLKCQTSTDCIVLSTADKGNDAQRRPQLPDALSTQDRRLHRLIIITNYNNKGATLGLDHSPDLAHAVALYAATGIEAYTNFFPQADETLRPQVMAIGMSECYFDRQQLHDELVRLSTLKVIEKEQAGEQTVDTNRAAAMAQKNLKESDQLVQKFFAEQVKNLLNKEKSITVNEAIIRLTPEIDKQVEQLGKRFTDCIMDDHYSLPEKQAIVALTLGTDDPTLVNYLYDKDQLTLDDCLSDPIETYLKENNALPGTERDENGDVISESKRIINQPDSDEPVVNPLPEIKQLRADIMRDRQTVRLKTEELKGIGGTNADTAQSSLKTETDIRREEIERLIEKKTAEIAEEEKQYEQKRSQYEQLVQTLSDQRQRETIATATDNHQKETIKRMKDALERFRAERLAEIDDTKRRLMKESIAIAAIALLLAGAFALLGYYIDDWLESNWAIYLGIIVALCVVGWFFHYYQGHSEVSNKRDALDEEAGQRQQAIKRKERHLTEHPLRLRFAGMFIDRFYKLQRQLSSTYESLRLLNSRCDNLASLLKRNDEGESEVNSSNGGFTSQLFMPVIDGDHLKDYFDRNSEKIIGDVRAYHYLDRPIEEMMADLGQHIDGIIGDFTMYQYLTATETYPYLPAPQDALASLLPKMEQSSIIFLQATDNINQQEALFIALRTDTEKQREQWNRLYPQHFSKCPTALDTATPNHLLLLRRRYLDHADIQL